MRRLVLLVLIYAFVQVAQAQQDPQFSLSMFNKQVLNQAYVGIPGAMQLTVGGRSQWVGIDGHPNTFTASFNAPVPLLRGALGLHVVQDQIGPFSTTTLRGAYAFRIPIRTGAIHLGISPGFFFKSLNGQDFHSETPALSDNVLKSVAGQTGNKSSFDLGAGAYYSLPSRSSYDPVERFYAGVYVDHILEPTLDGLYKTDNNEAKVYRNISAMVGFKAFGDGKDIALVPNLNFRMQGPQMQVDLIANLHVRPMVFGFGYRGLSNADALIGVIGFHASQRLFVAYSYDYTLSALGVATSGSHDIVIQYTFPLVTRILPPNLDVKHNPDVR